MQCCPFWWQMCDTILIANCNYGYMEAKEIKLRRVIRYMAICPSNKQMKEDSTLIKEIVEDIKKKR